MGKHILVIAQYFYPEQFRINDISTEWVKKGYKVTVVTGIPNYPMGKYYEGYGLFENRKELYKGVNIIRLPLIPRGKSTIMLVLNYFSFVISGFFWKTFTKIDADFVFIFEVSPMTQALPGVWYAKKKNIPCFLYVQDLWPENVEIITGVTNKYIIGSISRMVDYIYIGCTKIFTTSNSFLEAIHKRGVPLEKINYWPQYAEEFYVPLGNKVVPEIDKKYFNITFTGNVGTAQGLDVLPKVALLLKKHSLLTKKKIMFNIVGEGRYKYDFIETVNKNKVSDMFTFIDKKPEIYIPKLLAASDLAFLSLTNSPLFSMTIPAKLQSYMACGIPIIASANGETEKIIRKGNMGMCSPAGDAEKLVEYILILEKKTQEELAQLGLNARAYYDKNFDKKELLAQMDRYFRNIKH